MPNGIFSSFKVSASGLSAQRRRLDIIAENLANVETTRTPEGGPYRRKRAVLETETAAVNNVKTQKNFLSLVRNNLRHMSNSEQRTEVPGPETTTVQLSVADDDKPFRMEYDPGHPDADDRGYVLKPNVNLVEEMVDMILATRAYQANAVALDAAKDMFIVSLEI